MAGAQKAKNVLMMTIKACILRALCLSRQRAGKPAVALWMGIAILGWGGGVLRAELVDRIVAVVNDDIILHSELDEALSVIEAGLERQGYSPAEKMRILQGQRKKALDKLIYDKLTDQQVQRNELKIGEEEVDATIVRIREANKLSEEELLHALEMDGMTYDEYRNQLKDQMLRSQLVNREVKSKIVITEEDVKRYYDAHQEQYVGSVKYDLRHILINVSPDADPSEKSVALKQINLIRERLRSGEPFEKMAERFSQAPTASRGGRLGVFGAHLLTENILKALQGLDMHQFSDVVETDQGYQIFYLDDIINTGGKTLEEATPEIYDKLFAEVVDETFNTWLQDLRKRSHIQILE